MDGLHLYGENDMKTWFPISGRRKFVCGSTRPVLTVRSRVFLKFKNWPRANPEILEFPEVFPLNWFVTVYEPYLEVNDH